MRLFRKFRITFIWVHALAAAATASADEVLLLSNPKVAANARLNLAHEAKSEVLTVYYKINADRAGYTLLAQLRETARKGRRAVLVLDAFASQISPKTLSYLVFEGVEVYRYHPFSLKNPMQYLERLHSKIFVVDGDELISGDRNVGNEYFGLTDDSFISRDAYVKGKAARVAKEHIEKLIQSGEAKKFAGVKLSPNDLRAEKVRLDLIESKKLTQMLRTRNLWRQGTVHSDLVEFYGDPIEKTSIEPGVDQKVIDGIDRARGSLIFENAYVALPPELRDALKRASARGVAITAITNSAESTDVKAVAAAWEESRKFLASIGADVWEHPGSPNAKSFFRRLKEFISKDKESVQKFRRIRTFIAGMKKFGLSFSSLHAKTMIVDHDESYVMSFNLDPRSQKLNLEVATRIQGEPFADTLRREVYRDLERAQYRLVAHRGREIKDGGTSTSCVTRLLSWLFKSQL